MSGPTGGGWGPPPDPYEPTPPTGGSGPSWPPQSTPPPAPTPPPSPAAPAPPAPPYRQPPQNEPPYSSAQYGGGYGPPPGYNPPAGYPYGPGGRPPSGGANRTVLAVIGVVVVALVVSGLVIVLTRKSGSTTPSTRALTTPVTSTAPTNATTTSPTSTSSSGTTSGPTTDASSGTSSPTTSPSATPTFVNYNLCTENDASTDLIHLTVTLSYAASYKAAQQFERDVVDSCVTPAAIKTLGPYFGKTFGLPGGDLTGSNGTGATARYSVQLINTTKYVTFTLNRKVGTTGYQIVSLTAS
jgi:hypothetical protein